MALTFEKGMKRLISLIEDEDSKFTTIASEDSKLDKSEYSPLATTVFTSLSASAASSVVSEQLYPISLDKAENKDYNDFFFPRSPSAFSPLMGELANVSVRLGGYISLLKYCVVKSHRLASYDADAQAEDINRKAQTIFDRVTASDLKPMVKGFLDTTKQGNSHVITPSKRFKGGFDFKFLGSLSNKPALSTSYNLLEFNRIHSFSTVEGGRDGDETYKQIYLENYASELSQSCISIGKELHTMLLGSDSVSPKKASTRVDKYLPLDFDFTKLNDLFLDKTGIVFSVNFMEGIDSNIIKKFKKYISISFIRTPNDTAIAQVLQARNSAQYKARAESTESGTDVEPKPVDIGSLLEKVVNPEGLALDQSIDISFTMSIPENIARYITQSTETENVSRLSLHNWIASWSKRYLKPKGAASVGVRMSLSKLPKVVLPLSKAQNISSIRESNNYSIEKGKGDENNIFVGPDGGLTYGMNASQADVVKDNVIAYESDMELYLEYCFDNGIPAHMGTAIPRPLMATTSDFDLADNFTKMRANVSRYSGKVLTYNWDYNLSISSQIGNPTNMDVTDLVGSAKLDDITLADYLGMDLVKSDGEKPVIKTFSDTMILMQNYKLGDDATSSSIIGDNVTPHRMVGEENQVHNSFLGDLLNYYRYSLLRNRVPKAQELVDKAKAYLNIKEFNDLDTKLTTGIMFDVNSLIPIYTDDNHVHEFLGACVRRSLNYASGGRMMSRHLQSENPDADPSEIMDLIEESTDYFVANTSPASNFGRLYSHLPGLIFKYAMEAITQISPKDMFSIEEPLETEGGVKSMEQPRYDVISKIILPQATIFSKYIPEASDIIERAKGLTESIKPDTSITADDINISGGDASAQMFPHQVKTHQALRKRPDFAILDIAPGGGKTSIGLTDIASITTEINEIGGKPIRPLILCPDGLIKNWVDDMKIFTKNKWNMVPINSSIVNRWGYEKLDSVIKDAPVNTIVVAGFNFLKSKVEAISIGTYKTNVSNNLEFIKRYGFDYILIDESHKLKNKKAVIHKAVKQLTTSSSIRYLRLATGTLINNVVSDIVGQTALKNGHIFREEDIMDASFDSTEASPDWAVDSPKKARHKLGKYASVTTLKKKEWAFMLPSPIEAFHKVPITPVGDSYTESEINLGKLHQQLYDAVIQETEADLQKLVKSVKNMSQSQLESREEKESDVDFADTDLEMDLGDDFANVSMADLAPYLQRIEMLLTNPMGDIAAPLIFGESARKDFHSTKAQYISHLIDKHFSPNIWTKDRLYKEYDFLKHDGKLYLARKYDKSSSERVPLSEETRGVEPSKNPEIWKEEAEGKVIVFCRYTSSVNGVYNALPDHYKKISVKYTGEETDKLANLDAFTKDPNVKVLVANEQGIMEGHNLQMASRIIRVESPWAPGDLDQASSRVFRPDPKATKDMINKGRPGELAREAIFLDWVMADNSMEVPKQARLISKIVRKSGFDEADNPLYADLFESYGSLPTIKMGLDLLRSKDSFSDYESYVDGYKKFNEIQREEFHQMRVTSDHSMISLHDTPEVPGSKKVLTPFVSNQQPNQIDLGLVTLRNYVRDPANHVNIDELIGTKVMTDMGPGRIAYVKPKWKKVPVLDENGNPTYTNVNGKNGKKVKGSLIVKEYIDPLTGKRIPDPNSPISSLTVKSSVDQSALPSIKDIGSLFVVTKKLSASEEKKFHLNNLHISKKQLDKEKLEEEKEAKRKIALERAEESRKMAEAIARRKQIKRDVEAKSKAEKDAKKRKANLEAGLPLNSGIKRNATKLPKVGGRTKLNNLEDAFTTDRIVTLHPALFHGFLTLELRSDDDDAPAFRKLGFKSTGPYVYADVMRFNQFSKVFDYLEDNFVLNNASFNRLNEVQDAFESGARGIYNMGIAPSSTLPYFFAQRKLKVKNRKEVRTYPIVFPEYLRIAVDVTTSQAIRPHIGRSIRGASSKWILHPGHELYFAKNKTELKAKVRDVKNQGYTISNIDELMSEITNIKFRAKSK